MEVQEVMMCVFEIRNLCKAKVDNGVRFGTEKVSQQTRG